MSHSLRCSVYKTPYVVLPAEMFIRTLPYPLPMNKRTSNMYNYRVWSTYKIRQYSQQTHILTAVVGSFTLYYPSICNHTRAHYSVQPSKGNRDHASDKHSI